ncbi:hypothetical protein [Hypericibacter sp.]|uniref:hypothetical protein n=1 Tax=Hypericibacter sp. TaxID=2705401 RepID=UPI003D6D820D
MAPHDLTKGMQTAQTIWHEAHDAAGGRGGRFDLAAFKGQILYANGETAAFAGAEVIETSDDKEPFTGNWTVLLKDGSVSNQTFTGVATFKEGPDRVGGTGNWAMIGGTGRFATLRARGTFTWSIDGDDYRAEFSAASP